MISRDWTGHGQGPSTGGSDLLGALIGALLDCVCFKGPLPSGFLWTVRSFDVEVERFQGTNLPPDFSHLCGRVVVSRWFILGIPTATWWVDEAVLWEAKSGAARALGFMVQDKTTHRINHMALEETVVIQPVPGEVVSELFVRAGTRPSTHILNGFNFLIYAISKQPRQEPACLQSSPLHATVLGENPVPRKHVPRSDTSPSSLLPTGPTKHRLQTSPPGLTPPHPSQSFTSCGHFCQLM